KVRPKDTEQHVVREAIQARLIVECLADRDMLVRSVGERRVGAEAMLPFIARRGFLPIASSRLLQHVGRAAGEGENFAGEQLHAWPDSEQFAGGDASKLIMLPLHEGFSGPEWCKAASITQVGECFGKRRF